MALAEKDLHESCERWVHGGPAFVQSNLPLCTASFLLCTALHVSPSYQEIQTLSLKLLLGWFGSIQISSAHLNVGKFFTCLSVFFDAIYAIATILPHIAAVIFFYLFSFSHFLTAFRIGARILYRSGTPSRGHRTYTPN